jgi:hypothetical protein
MSRVEREEGPRFGPLRPGRPLPVPSEEPSQSSSRLDAASVAAWLAAGIASVAAAGALLVIWTGPADSDSQGRQSLVIVVAWLAMLIYVVARDHGRALRVFNLLALVCALIFVAVVVLAIIQFVRLAGEP